VFVIVLVLSLAITAGGIYLAMRGQGWSLLATGAGCVVATLLVWALAGSVAANRTQAANELESLLSPLSERMEQFSVMLNLISEQQLLSDRGKSIAYRNKDRDALRFAIQEEIGRADYEAAWRLADEMENSFGNRQEAEHFRQLIEDKRSENVRRHIADGLMRIDKLVRAERWAAAHREAEQLAKRYGDHEQVRNLKADIDTRRQQHKVQLTESFNDAVSRNDVDGAIELLKRLDPYLSSGEAESLQETARAVLKTKLEQLRSQFAGAVHEGNWHEALRIGDAVIRDFPNTQMAKEVREHMDTLRQRAGEPAVAAS
jgi:hypothetical protein